MRLHSDVNACPSGKYERFSWYWSNCHRKKIVKLRFKALDHRQSNARRNYVGNVRFLIFQW